MLHNRGYCRLGGFARLDTDRAKRRGFPEVIYAPGKTEQQLKDIAAKIVRKGQVLLITKLSRDSFSSLKKDLPDLEYNLQAKAAYLNKGFKPKPKGFVLIITAGTSDIPVAEESAVTLEAMGIRFRRLYDVGVAGVHRVISQKNLLRRAKVIVVVAGMEGALASLVSGLVCCPVLAVPTSVGYGSSFKGLSALLTMMNSCSPGVAVLNIDNGFGAGYFAGLINRM